jgi:hypothetical protein
MFGHRLGPGTEELEARARRPLEHADFEEKIRQILHPLSFPQAGA